MSETDLRAARGIADAILYEGYLLFPYTASAPKNRLRWQFGVIAPAAYDGARSGEHAHAQTELLVEARPGAAITVVLRFLQLEARTVEARADDDRFVPVPSLTVAGAPVVSFDEGVERDVTTPFEPGVERERTVPFDFGADRTIEPLRDGSLTVGRVVRERWPLRGILALGWEPLRSEPTHTIGRLRIRVDNRSAGDPHGDRSAMLRTALISAHALIGIGGGAAWSPVDPPDPELAHAAALANEHTWPVLVGDPGSDAQRSSLVLSSPILLGDFPQVAARSPADSFDATEIDELLNLSVLSLSDAERAEARATDPRARSIVERAEAFGAADLARIHGVTSPVTPAFGGPDPRGPLDAAAVAPASLEIGGVTVAAGSRVRLQPRRRADAWDTFLRGKIATVQAIHQDFEDRLYVAVTIDDDPASEYHRWYGRAFFFGPDEVEALVAP